MILSNQSEGLSLPNVTVSIPLESKNMPEVTSQKWRYLEVTTYMLKFRPLKS